jgi:lipopolysaccharide export system protein LptA
MIRAKVRRVAKAPLWILVGLLFPTQVARAEILGIGGDTVSLQAEHLDVDIMTGEATLTGSVTLTKGDVTVSCPRIDVHFDQTPRVTWARGSGGVTADVRGVHAESPAVEVDLVRQVLDLRGGVKLARGQSWMTADSARIELATGKVSLTQVKGAVPVAKGP